jgi:hypothetical protein
MGLAGAVGALISDFDVPVRGLPALHGTWSRYSRGCRCMACKESRWVASATSRGLDPYAVSPGATKRTFDPSDVIDVIAECMGQR